MQTFDIVKLYVRLTLSCHRVAIKMRGHLVPMYRICIIPALSILTNQTTSFESTYTYTDIVSVAMDKICPYGCRTSNCFW